MKSTKEIGVFIAIVFLGALPACFCGCGTKLDVAFLVDESGSVGRFDFENVKAFMLDVVNSSFDVGPNKTRVALITFSSGYRVKFRLNELDTKEAVLAKIKDVDYLGGSTETYVAIRIAHQAYLNARKPLGARADANQIAIIITDGASNNAALTKNEADLAKQQGIEMYAVAIGTKISHRELSTMASAPIDKHVFVADDFQKLGELSGSFSDVGCTDLGPTKGSMSTVVVTIRSETKPSFTMPTSVPFATPSATPLRVSLTRERQTSYSTTTTSLDLQRQSTAGNGTSTPTPLASDGTVTAAPNATRLSTKSAGYDKVEDGQDNFEGSIDRDKLDQAVGAGVQKFLSMSNPVVQIMVGAGTAFLAAVGVLACCLLIFFLKKRRPRVTPEDDDEDENEDTKSKPSPKAAWASF